MLLKRANGVGQWQFATDTQTDVDCALFSRLAKLSEWLARCDAYEASVFSFNTQPITSATRTSNGKHASW